MHSPSTQLVAPLGLTHETPQAPQLGSELLMAVSQPF
jgi:hypothetical protein